MSTLRRAEQEQEATQPLKQQHSCLARCENQALQLLAPELSRHQNAAQFDENKNQTVLSSCKSSQYQCKQKVYSLNIGHEKSSFYLKTELVEELKLYQSMEVSQKPTFVLQEMILKDKARRELSALNNNPSSSAHSNNKTRNQLEFDLLMSGTSEGALRISREENAGGNSVFSEALSFEVVKRMFSAELLKTEMEIEYYPGSKKTDYLVRIGQKKYGVSVTRAFNFNDFTGGNGVLTDKMLQLLLYKKLSGIIASSGNVYDEDVWEKQFLHCWVPSMDVAKRLKRQYAKMKCSVKSNTILLVTVASEARSIFMENSADHEQ
ncbi:hypothetical protein C9374_001432 [Naegleria lovaniensis]|uniref:Uncharacterized protein n=1 Tax=Naegleria lovaniensis TaxID=51637 RepID=A0AA88GY93_NAELO|nr:uncharacterized protein C9374_001432 [Naegleria lovaniensis]KAG2387838.1 hypothetical protein C9374_001432 [Naegleria lovaniensis]